MKLVILLCFLLNCVWCYKILGLFPHPGKSHFETFKPLLKALAKKGHEITVVGHFPEKDPLPNYKDIDIQFDIDFTKDVIRVDDFQGYRYERYLLTFMLSYYGRFNCRESLAHEKFQELIKSDQKFDLIIAEFFNTQCFHGAVHKFKAPLIGISTSILMPWHPDAIGLPNNPAYIPNICLSFSDQMSFFERVENTVVNVFQIIAHKFLVTIPNDRVARMHFGEDMPSLDDISTNTSLILVNNHFSITRPRPMVPNYIEVGGMHIGKSKPLPKHLEKWINESSHGVVYFSLGSMIKGDSFPEEKRQMFLKAFSRLPQRVLWKWETEMSDKPDNVMTQSWMPQFDILSHPNVKAFISHGGLLGSTEAAHCGVPMILLPQFGDQFTNSKAIEASGGGIVLDFRNLNEDAIYNGLKEALDPGYNKKVKEFSARFRDRPLPPLDTAIYWVEYVARHGGAPHLRTAAVGMPLYQYLLLDVVAFLIAIFSLISYIFYFITKRVFRRVFGRKTEVKVKKN